MNSFLEDFLRPFSFEIDNNLIETKSKIKRDTSKLLIADTAKNIRETSFSQLDKLLKKGDLLVLNNAKVEYRRVFLQKENNKTIFEALFLDCDTKNPFLWKILLSKSRKIKDNEKLFVLKDKSIRFTKVKHDGVFSWLHTSCILSPLIFTEIGEIPIPPYFNRKSTKEDQIFYQTVFASNTGSVAAPTASLHFTKKLLQKIQSKGVHVEYLTLHVGYGTFSPLRENNIKTSTLHKEKFQLTELLYEKIQNKKYQRLIAVGTTTLRVIEYIQMHSRSKLIFNLGVVYGATDLFYYPPYQIKSVDYLITNFHLSRSSLLLFIMCLQSQKDILSYYDYAIKNKFKFYSYGDAMFLKNIFRLKS